MGTPTDKDDGITATKDLDVLSGGKGKDTFYFQTDFPNDLGRTTLNDGDRITDYEFGEAIDIEGVRVRTQDVELEYNDTTKQTRIKLDLDQNGSFETTIILDGDKTGRLQIDTNCCSVPTSTIRILKAADQNATWIEPSISMATMIDLVGMPTHEGTDLADVIFLLDGNDLVFAVGGADTLVGGDGDDTLNGGDGPDVISGDRGNDTLNGEAGDDQLFGGIGEDQLLGGADDDYLDGDAGADSLDGGTGNDTLRGGDGADVATGGAGDDVFVYSNGDIDPGERISDYEYGEKIDIGGITKDAQVRLTPGAGGSTLEFDFDGDGTFDSGIRLDGVDAGKVEVLPNGGGVRVLELKAGSSGADIVQDSGGAAFFLGEAGFDTFVTTAKRSDVFVNDCESLTYVGDFSSRDVLSGFEKIVFDGGTLRLDTEGSAGQGYRLYQAAFARMPDPAGLQHNVGLMDEGLTLKQMSAAFLQSAEFIQRYGSDPSDTAFVEALYQNVLNRAPDDAGREGWLARLADASWDRADVLIGFSESPENKSAVAAVIDCGIWFG
ncbi:DUF4214 domain-containing protein [Rhabdaerophilum sp. SD176]|uniref:DUF4214 domain-containing protein n=1 Tax=Rhabdaerophilum sp. SD176 TaxID=2983548 RepID=UPI0024DFA59A|nr:DUF4214 domain-containing protein [Rhabdaerophilum sp. SD176]